jgi:DNA-binding transcriptional LysR family regulator
LLEGRLGVSLFDRHSRGVTLTDAGLRLLPYAGKLRSLLRDARRAIEGEGAEKGPLLIGAVPAMSVMRLAPVLPRYVALCPNVELELRTNTTANLVEDVLRHSLEGAFVCGPVVHSDLMIDVLAQEELVLVSAAGDRDIVDRLAGRDTRAVVMGEGCSYRQRLDGILSRRGALRVRHMEIDSLDAVIGYVSAGFGVSLLPRSLAMLYQTTVPIAVHGLAAEEARLELLFIRLRESSSWGALNTLVELVRNLPPHEFEEARTKSRSSLVNFRSAARVSSPAARYGTHVAAKRGS